jgi:CheY-like chemotaxis protein
VTSELGRGSSFFVELPIVYKGEADVAGEREEMPAPEFSRPTVLLIAPDAQVFLLVDPAFKTSGFQLIHVESLERAETWLQRHQPHAVVLDIDELGNPGWDFLRFFPKPGEPSEQIPVIAVTPPRDATRALDSEAALAISKPLDPASLLQDVRRVTRQEKPKKLLLVDDNDLSLYILRELLDRPWLNLLEAHNGQEALDIIDREQPDAVILDLVMPGMGGFEVLEKLRDQEQTRRLPVIVYTSKLLTGEEKKRLTDLAAGLIAKSDVTTSLSPESLLNSLAKMDIAGPEGN